MCLIVIAFQYHKDYPVIIAANRDEFYSRPTAALDYWEDHPFILAGRDLISMGTWLGVSKKGRISAVTNYRDPASLNKKSEGPSRGHLASGFLKSSEPAKEYLESVRSSKDRYEGFNLIAGSAEELWWYSNVADRIKQLTPGIHGISNSLLNTPWPKVEKMKKSLCSIIEEGREADTELIFEKLADTTPPPDNELPDTGLGPDWERTLSPVFITSSIYGTRSSSILSVSRLGTVTFFERSFRPENGGAAAEETRRFVFTLDA